MATLYIEEYDSLPRDASNHILPIVPNPVTNQKVAIAGSSAQSAATNGKTKFVRLITDTACQYAIAADPTASATSLFLPSGAIVDREIKPGDKIAVITQA
jgi:hypothetical protein